MRKLIATLFLCGLPAFGAIASTMQWDVRTTGSDSNSAGFDPGVGSPGTDESQQNSGTTMTVTVGATTTQGVSTPVFSATTHGPGNTMLLTSTTSGSCNSGVFEELSQSTGTATFDRALGTAASVCVYTMGGSALTLCSSWSSGCQAGAFRAGVNGNTIWVKSGTYSCGTTLVSVNCYENDNSSNSAFSVNINGYASTHGDITPATVATSDTRPLIQSTADSIQLFNITGQSIVFVAVSLKMNCTTTCYNMVSNQSGNHLTFFNCKMDFHASTGTGGSGTYNNYANGITVWATEIYCNSTGAGIADLGEYNYGGALWIGMGSYIHGCAQGVWDNNAGNSQKWYVNDSIFANNTRHLYQQAGGITIQASHSLFYNATDEAIRNNVANFDCIANFDNNVFWGGTYALYWGTYCAPTFASGSNAYGDFSTANYHDFTAGFVGAGDIALTADPTTNGAGGVFTLNNTSGGGALLRALGYPGSSPAGTGYIDVGPLQSQGATGGAAPHAYQQ